MVVGRPYSFMNILKIKNWINGSYVNPENDSWVNKYNPHNGEILCKVADSSDMDVDRAVVVANNSFVKWANTSPVERGQILFEIARLMEVESDNLSRNIALEAGKPIGDARGEVGAAISQAKFFAGEGMRLYGKSLTSGTHGKYSHTIRQPHGTVGLIVPANTPIANIAWKIFPALICGNTAVLKSSEDSPSVANMMAEIAKRASLPDGVLNIIQGTKKAGVAIVENTNIPLISFTGSTSVGQWIASAAGKRLARVSLELGGKNSFVVCDDADIDQAVNWASLSAFSNAGQRCAAASRILVHKDIYDEFLNKLVAKAKKLKVGIGDDCDLGPVINSRQHKNILSAIDGAVKNGGRIVLGGSINDPKLNKGYYVLPTIIENLANNAEINTTEIFGPVVTMQKFEDINEALLLANDSNFGLTAAIHTTNVDKAMWYAQRVRTGVVNINIGTYGSEPHMPFGGFGFSGNGTREPGVEALDVYSELKNISFLTRENLI
jgi:alpha-ketoglutaric semialdehyde dehydrogenase